MYDSAKAGMENATKKYSEDYAKAVEAQENCCLAYYAFSDAEFNDGSKTNELDLKPTQDGATVTTWSMTKQYRDYIIPI